MGASGHPRRIRLAATTAGFALCGSAAIGLGVFGGSPAGSFTGDGSVPGSCTGDRVVAFGGTQDGREPQLVATFDYPEAGIPTWRAYELDPPLAPDTYEAQAFTFDGFDGRASWVTEPNERVVFEFYDADEQLVARSEPTPDLEDGVNEASWSGSLGQLSWDGGPAAWVVVRHLEQQPGDETYNKVDAVCLGLSVIPDVTTTTVAPTSTTLPSTSTTIVTTTTSTTLPVVPAQDVVEVLGRVQVPATPAAAQVAQPSFTG